MKTTYLRNILLIALVLVVSTAGASDSKYKKLITKADRYFDGFVYPRAVDLYTKAFEEKDDFDPYAALQIADSYRRMNKPVSAEKWYAKLDERD